ncbi:hypothetical protein AVEN_40403-1 [Araneus ventricosus]|uniref:Uncharacterized protein n=1 Tax=Araneus ventricosus TaxID=182803 RepID=A0A4Y2D9I4_ARAVE|nr:hypothetical protein AVEN_40403-1 [Araneus ventricosus]
MNSRNGSPKTDHSPLLHFGIFGTREGKANRQGRKPMKFGTNILEVVELQQTQNPKLHPPIPIWDLNARVGGKQRICLHWDLASRLEMKLEINRVEEEENGWEEFCDFEPCLKTNCGTSVNVLPNFSINMSGIHTSCWDKWLSLSFSGMPSLKKNSGKVVLFTAYSLLCGVKSSKSDMLSFMKWTV